MKVYLLKEEDFEYLLAKIEINPSPGEKLTDNEREAFDKAFRYYNYHVRTWIESVKK